MITESQMERRYSALSVNCKKVYDAVPISEPWSTSYILSEIQRKCSYTSNHRVLTGSLNTLKASGLIREPSPGLFVRSPIKQADSAPRQIPTVVVTEKEEPMPAQPKAKNDRSPMEILASLAVSAKALSDAIETAAVEIDEYVASKGADSEKLKQLQALLKGLG